MIPRSTTSTPEGRRIRVRLLWAAALILTVNLAVWLLGNLSAGERVSGPDGSSYVTTAYGSAALVELLEGEDIAVTRLRNPYVTSPLQPGQTLVLIEAGFGEFAPPELDAIASFLQDGGRLVMAGPVPDDLLGALGENLPAWQPAGLPVASATGELPGVDQVPLSGRGSFSRSGQTTPILIGEGDTAVAVRWALDKGSVVWLADSVPLLNLGLARGDSAGLAVTVMDGRPTLFDEYRHGFGGQSFWQALPDRWAASLSLMAAAGLAGMIAYARRLGPPQASERRLRPDRAAYIESVAALLGRTRRLSESISPVRARSRRLLADRAGLGQDPSEDALRRAGRASNLSDEEIEAVLDETGDPLAAGRALARLSQASGQPLP